jgi:predicted HicB family RNase H-like nuclease
LQTLAVQEDRSMAKESKRNDIPVKVDVGVVADAKIVAAYKGVSLAEYISETLRPIVEREMNEEHMKKFKVSNPKKAPK